MKKFLAWLMLLTMVMGLFAGCNQTQSTTTPTDPSETAAGNQEVTGNAQDAIDYLKGYYTDSGTETPIAYTRFGIVRVAGVPYDVVWTTNVSEDLVKIVKNEDGTVTVQVNEEATEATEYTLTATVTDANGNTATHTWSYTLPKGQDMLAVVDAAYALENGDSLPYESRLKGKVTEITAIYSEDYQNVSVVIAVEGAEDKPITCYRMKATAATAEQIKNVCVGNIITVTGTLKNYNGTIEFDAGCLMVAWEKGDAIEAPVDPGEIITAAYDLEEGESLPYSATLTGKLTAINTSYDASYGNITVTMTVDGYEDYPILCYRLKGLGVDQIAVGDIITVSGIIKNYRGTIEYDAGCQLISFEVGDRVLAPTDPYEILDQAYALDWDESLPYEVTLSGIVTSVDEPYTEQYNNITVTIAIPGALDQPITCYRMKGDGVANIKASDTITVRGIIKNYKGTREFDTGCQLVAIVEKGPGYHAPDTQEEIIEDIKTLPVTCTLLYQATLEGKIVKINTAYSSKYGNITVTIRMQDKNNQDYDLKLYRLEGDGIENLAVGNTIKVKGYLTNYVTKWDGATVVSSSKQMINGVLVESDATAPEAPSNYPVASATLSESTAYKLVMVQTAANKVVLFNGQMDGNYLGTTTNEAEAVDVKVEKSGNGYYWYFMDNGVKKYLGIYINSSGKSRPQITDAAETLFTYNADAKAYTVTLNDGKYDNDYYFGTYQDYTTIGASSAYYISGSNAGNYGTSQFVAHLMTEIPKLESNPGGSTGGGETTTTPEPVVPELGKAYKFGMVQGNVENKLFYINGSMDSYYMDTTEDAAAAVDVYLESANGGYYFYAMVGGAKKYINMVTNNSFVNGKYEDTASTVYTIDTANCSVKAEVNGESYSFGTRNDKTYTTVGPFKSSFTSNFFCKFYPAEGGSTGGGSTGGGSTGGSTSEPAAGSTLTIAEAIALGNTKEKDQYTDGKYYISGKITKITNTKYGNMVIEDAAGDSILVYGLYSADGTVRYDSMTTKPVVGDTIKVFGVIGKYNDPQMKDGWLIEHTPGSGSTGGGSTGGGSTGGGSTGGGASEGVISTVADLSAGTYYMSGYLTQYEETDFSAAPYHMWQGTLYYGKGDTTQYSYNNGVLSGSGAAAMKLVAVSGKANTYYIMVGDQYLHCTEYGNHKLALGDTKAEWVAANNANGGINMTTTVDGKTVTLGTGGAKSDLIRVYKIDSNCQYGLFFFPAS